MTLKKVQNTSLAVDICMVDI